MATVSRRRLLQGAAALPALSYSSVLGANDRIRVALVGGQGMGTGDLREFLKAPNVQCGAVCDVDDARGANGMRVCREEFNQTPEALVKDFRRLLDRKDIDALIVSTPDNWHALITIMACQAGKDVYVEKPLSLTLAEGDAMVKAARRYNRVVQGGTQYHSSPHLPEVTDYIASGKLGKVALVRCFCYLDWHPELKRVPDSAPPSTLDYDFWLGPAQFMPYNQNRCHSNFRWFWSVGAGLLGDWGVHLMDLALAGMKAGAPLSAASAGGKFAYPDDYRETPDTQQVLYEFPGFTLIWEHAMGHHLGPHDKPTGIAFYGSEGLLLMDFGGWQVFPESQSKLTGRDGETERYYLRHFKGPGVPHRPAKAGDARGKHVRNFLQCMRTRERPNADVEVCHNTTTLCHLGNISQRVGRKVRWDAAAHRITGDEEAQKMTTRPFRKPWTLPAV